VGLFEPVRELQWAELRVNQFESFQALRKFQRNLSCGKQCLKGVLRHLGWTKRVQEVEIRRAMQIDTVANGFWQFAEPRDLRRFGKDVSRDEIAHSSASPCRER